MLTLIFRFSVEAPTLRATIGTTLVLSGLVSAWFIWLRSTRSRQVSDLLLSVAVLMLTFAQFVFFAAPAITGSHSSDRAVAIPLIAHLEVTVMFAAAALARRAAASGGSIICLAHRSVQWNERSAGHSTSVSARRAVERGTWRSSLERDGPVCA
ncbi:MAG: hypothetical protein JO321_08880 [Solirubrobacterales bacterium]|nr:hypothetical protein [Solirubrobacterales bacterium]MBV9535509.1 hypothetical protein [Solirubrobacterales bacterium]